MNRFLLLLVFISIISCSDDSDRKGKDSSDREFDSGSVPAKEEKTKPQASDKTVKLGGNTAAAPKTPSSPSDRPKAKPVQDNIDSLVYNSGQSGITAGDFEFGDISKDTEDKRYAAAASFLKDVWGGKSIPGTADPEYKTVIGETVESIRKSGSFPEIRYGELRARGGGYFIPFRVMNDSRTGTGFVYVVAKNNDWYIQDIIFDTENIHDIAEETFAPSTYRWMEVY